MLQGEKRQTDTAAFGSGTPNEGGVTNIRESDQKIPNFLGGKGALRDDSIGPEVTHCFVVIRVRAVRVACTEVQAIMI